MCVCFHVFFAPESMSVARMRACFLSPEKYTLRDHGWVWFAYCEAQSLTMMSIKPRTLYQGGG